jgi:hypothetical protein
MRRTLVILVIVFLVASTANLLAAILVFQPATAMFPRPKVNVFGAEAAKYAWPERTPHPGPWPPLTQWVVGPSPGRTYVQATHVENGRTTHQMQVYYYGWPLPVMKEATLWWPDQDPAWTLSAPHDRGLQLCATGLIGNPLLATLAVALVFAPVVLVRRMIRRRRLQQGRCEACGYPAGVSDRCTECGAELPKRPATA